MRHTDRQPLRERLRTVVVLVAAALCFLALSLRTPTLALGHGLVAPALTAPDTVGDARESVERADLGRFPVARPPRSDGSRGPRLEGSLTPVAVTVAMVHVPTATSRTALAARPTRDAWIEPSKTHAELMVFLN